MKPWSVVAEQEQWLRGSKGGRGLIPGAWARERARREIYVMRCDNRKGRRDEKRRMVSERLFVNRASGEVEA